MELQPDRPPMTILVPVDFSTSSKEAVRVAIDLARGSGASLLLMHVHEAMPSSRRRLGDASPEAVLGLSAAEAQPTEVDSLPLFDSRLDALQRELSAQSGLHVEARLLSGPAAAQIIDVACQEHSDLIV